LLMPSAPRIAINGVFGLGYGSGQYSGTDRVKHDALSEHLELF